jgi:hypothetical protein
LLPTSFPDWNHVRSERNDVRAAELQKRCTNARALGIYRLSKETFVFCFDGELSRSSCPSPSFFVQLTSLCRARFLCQQARRSRKLRKHHPVGRRGASGRLLRTVPPRVQPVVRRGPKRVHRGARPGHQGPGHVTDVRRAGYWEQHWPGWCFGRVG